TKTAGVSGNTSFVVECDQSFVIRGSHMDYESGSVTVSSDSESVTATLKLRPVEQIIVEDRVVLAPIHFDFDKHNIKPQAALELDKLVQVMKKYPKMEIRVEAHRSEERRVGKEQKSRQTRSNHKEKSNIR